MTSCELCHENGGEVLWHNDLCRVVLIDDPDHHGFCQVIVNQHVKEMTDLPIAERTSLMHVVFATEEVMRSLMSPDKINLACLGNVTPHVHWHVIPRFTLDPQFPNPIWGERLRNNESKVRSHSLFEFKVALQNKMTELMELSSDNLARHV